MSNDTTSFAGHARQAHILYYKMFDTAAQAFDCGHFAGDDVGLA